MLTPLWTVDDLDVEERRVLLRADFDVPLRPVRAGDPALVGDDGRIRGALVTIEELRRRGARLVLVSSLGRPSAMDPAFSMRPVADRLGGLTGADVPLAPGVVGPRVRELTEQLAPGEMLMLENARFEPGEARNDPALASALAELADLYVDDAFASAHHVHASTCGVAERLPSAAGRLMEREVAALSAIVEDPARPLVAVIGGARLRDSFGAICRLLELADVTCIGGAIAVPFLAARGHSVGRSLCSREDVEAARLLLAGAAGLSGRLELPEDLVVGRWGSSDGAEIHSVPSMAVPDRSMALDIGPDSAEAYADEIAAAQIVFWSGPMGRFELAQFAAGTRTIAQALATSPGATVVAGGETRQALRRFGLLDRVSHVSSGGRATLEFIAGHELPAVQVLARVGTPTRNVIAAPACQRSAAETRAIKRNA